MTVSEYIDKKNYSLKDFADLIGVSVGIVRLWECRGASPRLIHALRINKLTKGRVKMSEMLTTKEEMGFVDGKN